MTEIGTNWSIGPELITTVTGNYGLERRAFINFNGMKLTVLRVKGPGTVVLIPRRWWHRSRLLWKWFA